MQLPAFATALAAPLRHFYVLPQIETKLPQIMNELLQIETELSLIEIGRLKIEIHSN